MAVTASCRNRGQVVLLNCQKLEGHNYHNDWQGHCSQRSLTQEELRQLIENSLPRGKIDGLSTMVLINIHYHLKKKKKSWRLRVVTVIKKSHDPLTSSQA